MPSQWQTGYTGQGFQDSENLGGMVSSPQSFQDRLHQQSMQNGYYNQPSAYNTAAFSTPTAQQVGMQQQQLAALMQGQYQQQPFTSPYYNPQQQAFNVAGELNSFINASQLWAEDSERWYQLAQMQQQVLQQIAPFVQTAQIWAQDAENWENAAYSAYQTANYLWELLNDPEFLISYAFAGWENNVTADDGYAVNLISENYLALANRFDQLFQQKYGILPTAQQQPGMPVPPVPGVPGQVMSQEQQMVERMKNPHPDLAKQMQQEHNARRMAMGAV